MDFVVVMTSRDLGLLLRVGRTLSGIMNKYLYIITWVVGLIQIGSIFSKKRSDGIATHS